MALKFTSTDQASASQGVKVLVYGDSGLGKTVLCSTAPHPIILSAEAGLLSLRKFKIPAIEIRTIEDLTEAYQWVTTSKEAQSYWTVCLDSITEIAEVVLANAKKLVKDPRQAYGELLDKMAMTVRFFRDLPNKHVYMSAKQELHKDEVGVTKFMPSMPGSKLGPALPYYFDEVFCLRVAKPPTGEPYRYLQTSPDIQYVAKDRSGCLASVEQPNLGVIFQKIMS